MSENNSLQEKEYTFGKLKVKPLEGKAGYNLWRVRLKAHFKEVKHWNIKEDVPMNTDAAASTLISALSDDLLEQVIDNDQSASMMWKHFASSFVTSDLSAKATSLQSIMAFNYPCATMLENKTYVLGLKRDLKAAHGHTGHENCIDMDELATLFCLVNIPPQHLALRSTIEETSKDETLEMDNLFTSLIRDEKSQTASHVVNRVSARRAAEHIPSPVVSGSCAHFRDESLCWTCHPEKKPPACAKCVAQKIRQNNHKPDSKACQFQQFLVAKSKNNRAALFTVDSGATDTLVTNKQGVEIYKSIAHPIHTANGSIIMAEAIGKFKSPSLSLEQVLVCPKVTENLLSVSKLNDQGLDVLFSNEKVFIGKNFQPGDVFLDGLRRNNSFFVSLDMPNESSAKTAVSSIDDWHLKFNHLNQKDLKLLASSESVSGMGLTESDQLSQCAGCMIGKLKKGNSPTGSRAKSERVGEMVWCDIIGPITPISKSGYRYILVFLDDYSAKINLCLLKAKSEATHQFKLYDARLFNQSQRHVECLRSDNGGEFKNGFMTAYCTENGIRQEFTIPENSQQNREERWNLTILDAIRAMLASTDLPKSLWDEAALCVEHTRGLSPTSSLGPNVVPDSLFYNLTSPPSVAHLREFGAKCFLRTPKSSRNGKLADRGVSCIFVGYCKDAKGYRLLMADGKTVKTAVYEDVHFSKGRKFISAKELPARNGVELINRYSILEEADIVNDVSSDSKDYHTAESEELDDGTISDSDAQSLSPPAADARLDISPNLPVLNEAHVKEQYPLLTPIDGRPGFYKHPRKGVVQLEEISHETRAAPLPEKRRRKQVKKVFTATKAETGLKVSDLVNFGSEELLNILNLQWYKLPPSKASRASSSKDTPVKYSDIEWLENSQEWYKASDEEIAQLISFGTWELVPLPPGRKAVGSVWVYRIKRDKNNVITRYKARLCAQGFSQIKDLDYKEVFAPVFRLESFRLFLAIVASRGMHLRQMDVKGAFLNGVPEEEVFMRQPPGYTDPDHPNWVCKLMKNLYGLKQAPRVWHKVIDPFLKELGYQPNLVDPCVYFKFNGSRLSIICLYVDNLAIGADDLEDLALLQNALRSRFQMTDEDPGFMLGVTLQYEQSRNLMRLCQRQAIESLLVSTNMASSISASTPMESLTVSEIDCPGIGSEEWHHMQKVPYRETIGSLTHISRHTRPDIAYALGVCSRYLHNPGRAHWEAVKRILRYLKGTSDFTLIISPQNHSAIKSIHSQTTANLEGTNKFFGLSDADWAGDRDKCRSTSGYAFYLGGALVSWQTRTQPTTATSSNYAEIIACHSAVGEAVWARSFLSSFGWFDNGPTTILTDNEAVVSHSKDHMITARNKSFSTKYHWIREKAEEGDILLQHIPGEINLADVFTKPLSRNRFENFRSQLGLQAYNRVEG